MSGTMSKTAVAAENLRTIEAKKRQGLRVPFGMTRHDSPSGDDDRSIPASRDALLRRIVSQRSQTDIGIERQMSKTIDEPAPTYSKPYRFLTKIGGLEAPPATFLRD